MNFIQRRVSLGFFYEGEEKPKRLTGLPRIGIQKYLSNEKTDLNFSCFFFFRKTRSQFFKTFNSFVPPPIFNTLAIPAILTQIFLAFPFSRYFFFFKALMNYEKGKQID